MYTLKFVFWMRVDFLGSSFVLWPLGCSMKRLLLGWVILFSPMLVFSSLLVGVGFWIGAVGGFVWMALMHGALEHFLPDLPDPEKPTIDRMRDMVHSLVYGLFFGGASVALCWVLSSTARSHMGYSFSLTSLHPFFQVLIVLLLGDLVDFVRHWSEHQSAGILWRIHSVHHSIRYFTTYTGARLHPLEPLLVYSGYGLGGVDGL